MPDDLDNPDSLGDDRTFTGERDALAQDDQSLGEQRTNPDGPVSPDGDSLDADSTGNEKDLEGIDLEPGLLLEEDNLEDRYQFLEELGEGGMGKVYKAFDKRLKRDVAIKRPKKFGERFSVEAEAHAKMNHQNIVKLFDVGSDKDGPYIIMEYVEGDDLRKILKQGPMDAEVAVNITCQLCDAITFTYNRGVIHRDIKPSNILLDTAGIPKLMDFGLARDQSGNHGQTKSGEQLGTRHYMSPEQELDPRKVDTRSDIYSLAATLYNMLTKEPPSHREWERLPGQLRPVVRQGMAIKPSNRFNNADEFRNALQEAIVGDLEQTEEGVCPVCSIKNRIDRKRCSTCSESLEEPCLACDHNNRLWEQVCDNCGTDTLNLITEKREEIRKERATVDSYSREYRYLEAIKIVDGLSKLPHRRFEKDVLWATEMLFLLDDEYADRRGMAAERYQRAQKEEDLGAAIEILEEIPSPLRTEEISAFYNGLLTKHERLQTLVNQIKEKVSSIEEQGRMSLDELEELIGQTTECLKLAPGRKDMKTLRQKLLDRLMKLVRDTRGNTSRTLFEQDQRILSMWPKDVRKPAEISEMEIIKKQLDLTGKFFSEMDTAERRSWDKALIGDVENKKDEDLPLWQIVLFWIILAVGGFLFSHWIRSSMPSGPKTKTEYESFYDALDDFRRRPPPQIDIPSNRHEQTRIDSSRPTKEKEERAVEDRELKYIFEMLNKEKEGSAVEISPPRKK